tara:strand:- start:188 stop:1396 length:1209 start_codon:yes stop_codon:yes gene_type:complete
VPSIIKYFNFIQKHFSLFVIAFGSLCFFILNVLLKEQISSYDYGTYSMFITYISLLSSFGMLGFEQTLLRTSEIKSKLEIDKGIIFPSIISILFVSTIGSYLMFNNYDIQLDVLTLFVFSILVILTKLIFNLYRLRSKFTISQISINFWKIALFFIVGYYILFDIDFTIQDLFVSVFFLFCISGVLILGILNKVVFNYNKSGLELVKKSSLFFLILFTISLISFGDRFFIESRFGLSELGDYFFYINIFLFPFSLFQTYIGFKEIVSFKKDFSLKLLRSKIILASKYSSFFSIILFFSIYLVEHIGLYDLKITSNLNIIIPLIFLGNIKIVYSLFSSAIGAIANDTMLANINIKSILSIILILPCIYYFSFNISITIIFIITLWVIRCLIWYNQLKKYKSVI